MLKINKEHQLQTNVKIDWEKADGLVPVIAQDSTSKEVLMLAYMNEEALGLTLSTGYAHYFSRSKQRIWKKGESSGHTQKILEIKADCDNDTILVLVEQTGAACHTGRDTCFFTDLQTGDITTEAKVDISEIYSAVDRVYKTIQHRKGKDPKSSYVASLFHKGENSILKKVVEEAGEFSFAIKDDNEEEIIYEAADLLFHSLVALSSKNITPDRIKQELARREGLSGITEKESRQK